MKRQDIRRRSKSNKQRISQVAAKQLFEKVQEKTERPYSAFTPIADSHPAPCLRVVLSNDNGRQLAAAYSHLVSVSADSQWSTIILKFSDRFSIVVSGHNLQPLHSNLLKQKVQWIIRFDSKIWKAPPPLGEPCVLGIEIRHALQ